MQIKFFQKFENSSSFRKNKNEYFNSGKASNLNKKTKFQSGKKLIKKSTIEKVYLSFLMLCKVSPRHFFSTDGKNKSRGLSTKRYK